MDASDHDPYAVTRGLLKGCLAAITLLVFAPFILRTLQLRSFASGRITDKSYDDLRTAAFMAAITFSSFIFFLQARRRFWLVSAYGLVLATYSVGYSKLLGSHGRWPLVNHSWRYAIHVLAHLWVAPYLKLSLKKIDEQTHVELMKVQFRSWRMAKFFLGLTIIGFAWPSVTVIRHLIHWGVSGQRFLTKDDLALVMLFTLTCGVLIAFSGLICGMSKVTWVGILQVANGLATGATVFDSMSALRFPIRAIPLVIYVSALFSVIFAWMRLPKLEADQETEQTNPLELLRNALGAANRRPITIWILALVLSLIFVAMSLQEGIPDRFSSQLMVRWGGGKHSDFEMRDWWRLFTSAFVHANRAHLENNLYGLLMGGLLAEIFFGPAQVLTLIVVSAVAGTATAVWEGNPCSVGASCAIYGLSGASLAFLVRNLGRIRMRDLIRLNGLVWISLLDIFHDSYAAIAKDYPQSGTNPGHWAGWLAGFSWGLCCAPRYESGILVLRRRRMVVVSLLALTIFALMVVGKQDSIGKLLKDKNYDAALPVLTQRIEGGQGRATEYVWRGIIRYNNGDYNGAMSDTNTALRLDPNDTDALLYHAFARCGIGDHAGAILDYNRILGLKPGDNYNYTIGRRADSFLALRRFAEAAQDYDAYIRKSPNEIWALEKGGYSHLRLAHNARAAMELPAALKLGDKKEVNKQTYAELSIAVLALALEAGKI